MKMKSLVLLSNIFFAVISFSCREDQDSKPINSEKILSVNYSSEQTPSKGPINFVEYKIVINKLLPVYFFNLYKHDDSLYTYYDSIVVKDSSYKILQTINIYDKLDNLEIYSDKLLKFELNFLDFNFDGFKDIALERHRGATGNCWNNIYLYENDLHKFSYNYQLSKLCLPSVDSLKEQILAFDQGGGGNYQYHFYKWIKSKLILIREVQYWQNNVDPYQRRVELKRINGKIKTISDKIVTDNADDP